MPDKPKPKVTTTIENGSIEIELINISSSQAIALLRGAIANLTIKELEDLGCMIIR